VTEFTKSKRLDCKILVGDTVELIKSGGVARLPLIFLLNKHRKYTCSVHIYRHGKRDPDLSRRLALFLRKYFKDNDLSLVVENPKSFGNVIFWHKGVDKGMAFRKIKKYYPDYEFIMIGDDLADLKTLKEVKYFFSVNNAQEIVKQKSDYVASEEYTRGVVEALRYLRRICRSY
jgi:hydroxymethylpyrimidine pyrophosphatase-like HAD family hydrolase